MSGPPVRVAVQEGAGTVRIAGAEADGSPWLVAELPAPGPGVAALLDELVGPAPEELVLVHPGHWPSPRAAQWAVDCAALAARVRAVPAPLAAAGRGGVAVLDVGASGAEAVLLDPDGRVHAWRTANAGGWLLDELLAARLGRDRDAARNVREALSLLSVADGVDAADVLPVLAGPLGAAVAALHDVLADADHPPVLLIGGVARSPVLAQLADEAGIAGAVVASRPDAAAVLGALTLPSTAGHTAAVFGASPHVVGRAGPGEADRRAAASGRPDRARGVAEDGPAADPATAPDRPAAVRDPLPAGLDGPTAGATARDRPSGGSGGLDGPSVTSAPWLPPPPPRRRRPLRAALLTAAAAGAVVVLLVVGRLVTPPTAEAVPTGVLVQYGYRLDVPAGWEHTGGLPERRRVLLTPTAAPDGSDLIAVERSPLGYDTAAEPRRAQDELRAAFDAAVAAGSALSRYDPDARFAGRVVTSYRQEESAGTVVDWFVVLDGAAQLSVGCRHTAAGAVAVREACALVVGSVRRA